MFMIVVFDNYETQVMINGESQKVSYWDTAGIVQNTNLYSLELEDYKKVRIGSYPNTDIFLICYSVVE